MQQNYLKNTDAKVGLIMS